MPYYAHVAQSADGACAYQTVAEHLTGTAALCSGFAAEFGAEADGALAGLVHDLGKCTEAFQNRLLRDGPIVDHATAGALACARQGNLFAAACVVGHHSGLPDFGNLKIDRAGDATLFGRLKKGKEEQYLERCGESGVALPPAGTLCRAGAGQAAVVVLYADALLLSCGRGFPRHRTVYAGRARPRRRGGYANAPGSAGGLYCPLAEPAH